MLRGQGHFEDFFLNDLDSVQTRKAHWMDCSGAYVHEVPSSVVQEEDVIGVLSTDNIADLKPLGDRILIEVGLLHHFRGSSDCLLTSPDVHM